HLEPEILLVDEVLAVGDLAFQKKCLGKMDEISHSGRTVLFVSHNMAVVAHLCSQGGVVGNGPGRNMGALRPAGDEDLRMTAGSGASGDVPDAMPRVGSGEARIRSVHLSDRDGHGVTQFRLGQPLRVTVEVEAAHDLDDLVLELGVQTAEGIRITYAST